MGRRYQERRIYPQAQAEVHQAADRALLEMGLDRKAGATEYEIQASQTMSALSWGERVTVRMATAPGGGTQVLAESKLVFGFVDWGRNQGNVEQLFSAMETVLGPGEPAPIEP